MYLVCPLLQLTVVQKAFNESANQLSNAAPTISQLLTNLSSVTSGVQGAINELLILASVQLVRPVSGQPLIGGRGDYMQTHAHTHTHTHTHTHVRTRKVL